jgi:hypothetical protein
MRKILMILCFVGIFISCNKHDEEKIPEFLGKWRLIEILVDPGDGSGKFHPVTSDKTIEFHADSTVTSNGSLCDVSIASDSPDTGIYSFAKYTITSPACPDFPGTFEQEVYFLVIHYHCMEGCSEKYVKE